MKPTSAPAPEFRGPIPKRPKLIGAPSASAGAFHSLSTIYLPRLAKMPKSVSAWLPTPKT